MNILTKEEQEWFKEKRREIHSINNSITEYAMRRARFFKRLYWFPDWIRMKLYYIVPFKWILTYDRIRSRNKIGEFIKTR